MTLPWPPEFIPANFSEASLLGHAMIAGAVGLVVIGLYAMVIERNLARIILGLALIGSGVNLFLVAAGYRADAAAPILAGSMAPTAMVDPLPQALVLTSIVIDVGVLALALALAIRVHEAFGTLDTREVQRLIAKAAAKNDLGSPPHRPDQHDSPSVARKEREMRADIPRLEELM